MKKFFLFAGASALMVAMAACSNNSESSKTDESSEAAQPAVEQLTPAEANLKAGQEYLANLQASDSTVVITPSGLGYKVISEGQGARPDVTNTVDVIYVGKHLDGSEFDNSQGEAISFPLNAVIPGFTEGISLMNKGAHYLLYIPGNLGYGPQGMPQANIRPNEMLVFDVELVDFK